jgi:hypothetical protein
MKVAKKASRLEAAKRMPNIPPEPELYDDEDEKRGPPTDCVSLSLIAAGIPLNQRNWIEAAYWNKSTIEELECEEISDCPDGFENWKRDDEDTVN